MTGTRDVDLTPTARDLKIRALVDQAAKPQAMLALAFLSTHGGLNAGRSKVRRREMAVVW